MTFLLFEFFSYGYKGENVASDSYFLTVIWNLLSVYMEKQELFVSKRVVFFAWHSEASRAGINASCAA